MNTKPSCPTPVTSENVSVTSGNVSITSENLSVTSGNASITSGNASVTSENASITSENVNEQDYSHGIKASDTTSGKEIHPIRLRAVFIGLFFSAVICAVTPFNNAFRNATPLGGGHFPLAPFFIFIWLTLFTALLGKMISHKKSPSIFTGRELFLSWILMVTGSGIAYTGLARTFFFNLTVPLRFATVENRWKDILQPLLPKSLYPDSMDSVNLLYTGLKHGQDMNWLSVIKQIPWHTWLTPLMLWGIFIMLCYWVMLCMINVLSRQWVQNENMNFPLLSVPRTLCDALDRQAIFSFFSDGFLLAGLMIPFFLHTLNGFHFYFPSVPEIPTLVLAGPYFPEYGIFAGFHKLKLYFYPAFIGFAFITSRQISFSFWFMFLLCGLLSGLLAVMGYNIPSSSLGTTFGPTLTLPEETQMIGAYGVFFIFIIWLSRTHIKGTFLQGISNIKSTSFLTRILSRFISSKNIITPSVNISKPSPTIKDATDNPELFNASLSAWGGVAGIAALIIWCILFGMTPGAAILVMGAFFMVMLVSTRIIAQGGVAYFTITAAPIDGIIAFFGPGFFTSTGILIAGVMQKMLFLDLRESLMPSLLHAAKIHEQIRSRRIIIAGILLVLPVSIIVSLTAMLALCHKYGLQGLQMEWAARTTFSVYEKIFQVIDNPNPAGEWIVIFSIAGALVMMILVICYKRFYWWPLHPLGYLTAYSSAMRILWVSFFIGWFFNTICIRYGGVTIFRKVRYFFIGLIIGDFLMGGIWAFAGLFSHNSYQVLPG
ncbi:conserved membrane hypothetical protein [Desulfamplus magnetovallimortis]|uniref:Uncharacterized protein n=1 Tax=Desulfamplus magnetovallimortis TaxID=1246637 RepID=A0A1W1HCC1_9BACT|nr:DUF6785 family protein [Desulfamplus magnetovallimortis]SLM30151.1 conserved membrane hypothetical protein [Desulfamplus magnetovallimortis]